MRLLKMYFDHLKMFEDGVFDLDFFTSDRVPASDSSATELERPIYTNNILAFAGINASGKSTALRLIDLAARVLNGRSISGTESLSALCTLFNGPSTLRCLVWEGGKYFLVKSTLLTPEFTPGGYDRELTFGEELIFSIPSSLLKKSHLASWDELLDVAQLVYQRSKPLLDLTIVSSFNLSIASPVISYECGGRPSLPVFSEEGFTLRQATEGTDRILKVFDARISHLEPQDSGRAFILQFENEEPLLLSAEGLAEVLSSGTMRGLSLVYRALSALTTGGYLLVDEIENHLNRQLVQVVLDLFVNKSTNPNGATIVFTTHYPQVLDHVHRKDNVYFLARGTNSLSTVVKYSTKVKRIENKKSEVFAANYIKGTAPRYVDVKALRGHVEQVVSHG